MNKKTVAIFISAMLVALCINGCGTTMEESLGDPPQAAKEKTAYPAGSMVTHELKGDNVIIKGGEGCVDSGVLVVISNVNSEVLAKTTADSHGAFEMTVSKENAPEEKILLQAQDKDKDLSAHIPYSWNPFNL